MRARTIHIRSVEETREALAAARTEGMNPVLAIVFASIRTDWRSIRDVLHEAGLDVLGATSCGEFTNGQQSEGAAAILLLDLPRDAYAIRFEDMNDRDVTEVAGPLAASAFETFNRPAFILCTTCISAEGNMFPGAAFLHSLGEAAGPGVNVFGGMAGDDYTMQEQFVFTGEQSSNSGVVVLALDEDKLIIKGKATGGWKPVGTVKTVTRSEGNRVYTIDDLPALDLTLKYAGLEHVKKAAQSAEGAHAVTMEILTTLTLQLQREVGDPVLRPGLIINWEDGSFFCSGTVPQGSKVRFSLPPDLDVMEEVIKGCEALKSGEMPDADAVVVFSCGGRILSLGPMMNMEIEGIRKVWNVPMAGMFSNAELARATHGSLEMHNLTTCCVVLKER